ncbi:MAG: nitroreductase family protein [Azospirillaceae bacterium]|nr:nitroreductase family protein [Azospirillaceae bacterium]
MSTLPPSPRRAAHDIAPVFTSRWSPRSFTGEDIPDAVLLTAFEAARWAPSGFNLQPWRFVYSKRGSASWATFVNLLSSSNRAWAEKASALILVASQTHLVWNGERAPARSHSFDSGAAWSNFAHQASVLGWHTHGIGGFDHAAAREALRIPDDFATEAIIAIGKLAPADALPEALRQREFPSDRLPLSQLVGADVFPAA